MWESVIVVTIVVVLALYFDFTNGFHDCANSVATVIATGALKANVAIFLSAVLNLIGALLATDVAQTIASGLVEVDYITSTVVMGGLIGAIFWNMLTWYFGIPSSSSHALIGGLIGATLCHAGMEAVQWEKLIEKVIIPLFTSPLAGLIIACGLMRVALWAKDYFKVEHTSKWFSRLQLLSAGSLSLSHGMNDAQKTMGIITLALFSSHGWSGGTQIPMWVTILCALAMGLGTASGGVRIIRTMGYKITKLKPMDGFVAETTAASIIFSVSHWGIPVSTTHCVTSTIFGVGIADPKSSIQWDTVRKMLITWFISLPSSAAVAAGSYWLISYILREFPIP